MLVAYTIEGDLIPIHNPTPYSRPIANSKRPTASTSYDRLGYHNIKRAAVLPHLLIEASGDALLMVKPLG